MADRFEHVGNVAATASAAQSLEGGIADPPPAYGSAFAETLRFALQAEHSTVSPHVDARSILRLSNFLSFVLSIDYAPRASHPCLEGVRLSRDDAAHIFEAGNLLANFRVVSGFQALKDPDMDVLCKHMFYELITPAGLNAADARRQIRTLGEGFGAAEAQAIGALLLERIEMPARALGLSGAYAASAIWRFIASVGAHGRYRGCLDHVLASQGAAGLARKFWVDRHIVIPKLEPLAVRPHMLEALEVQQRYFVVLKAAGFETVRRCYTDPGRTAGHDDYHHDEKEEAAYDTYGQVEFEKMELTKEARRFEKRMHDMYERLRTSRSQTEEYGTDAEFWDAAEGMAGAAKLHNSTHDAPWTPPENYGFPPWRGKRHRWNFEDTRRREKIWACVARLWQRMYKPVDPPAQEYPSNIRWYMIPGLL